MRWCIMIVPVSNVTCNDKTISNHKLEKDQSSDYSNCVCFFIRLTRLVSKCLCPNSPKFFHCTIITDYPTFCNFSTTVSFCIGATSFNPSTLYQGAFSQSNPSPKVLSAFATYQWHAESGTSTAHFSQSSDH